MALPSNLLPPNTHPSHDWELKFFAGATWTACHNCNCEVNWYDAGQPCENVPLGAAAAPEPEIAPALPERPTCWTCHKELSSYLDAYHGREPYFEMQCRDCQTKVVKAIAEFDAKLPV